MTNIFIRRIMGGIEKTYMIYVKKIHGSVKKKNQVEISETLGSSLVNK